MSSPTQRAIEALEKALKPLTEAHNAATDHFGEDDDGAINIYAGIEAINVALTLLRSLSPSKEPETHIGMLDEGMLTPEDAMGAVCDWRDANHSGWSDKAIEADLLNRLRNAARSPAPKEPASSPEGATERPRERL